MSSNWNALLQDYRDIARRLSNAVPAAFAMPDLTLDQAAYIHDRVQDGARAFDHLFATILERGASNDEIETAETLHTILAAMTVACATKVRAMNSAPLPRQGLVGANATIRHVA